MSDWYKISTIVTFTTKGITPKYVDKSSIVVLNQKCIRNNSVDYSFAQFTDETRDIVESKFVKKGDILVNSTGEGTAGRCAFIVELPSDKRVIVDSHILILRCRSYYEAFCLSYTLFSFEKILMSFLTGSSGQSELDKVVLLNIHVKIPKDLFTQKKIAKVLSDLDAKIELNNKVNKELESMAKLIYDYWFVQFDFPYDFEKGVPCVNGKPYKSSGGKMVYNEKLKREIPVGWEVKELSEITKISNDSINPALFPNKIFKHFSIPTFDATKSYGLEAGETIKSNKYKVEKTDVLVSKLNPSFNRVIYVIDEVDQICSTEFVVWRSENEFIKNFLYMIATSDQFIAYCMQSAAGTSNSHKRVNPAVMMQFSIPYNEFLSELYGEQMNFFLKKVIQNQNENKKLAELRDWLLPMLMNGQVSIGEAKEK